MKKLLIIDYEAGNIHSVINAFQSQAKDWKIIVSGDYKEFKNADKFVLPGVGSFRHCALALKSKEGLISELNNSYQKKSPILGICVGMQLLFNYSVEQEKTDGLGFFNQGIDAFKNHKECEKLKIPHMGWNQINFKQNHPLFSQINSGSYVYFANSYFAPKTDETLATCDYGISFSAVVGTNNLLGVQFHPEKSQKVGLQMIRNFLTI